MIPAILFASLLAFSPLKAEQEDVRQGNEKLVSGDGSAALLNYREAERHAGSHPEIDYDRGQAAFRLGKLDEAAGYFRSAAEKAPPQLSSRALQNLGNTLDKKGDTKGAVSAFVDALTRDPKNEDARYDLEVLLRKKNTSEESKENKGGDDKEGQKSQDKKGSSSPNDKKTPDEEKQEEQQANAEQKGAEGEAKKGESKKGEESTHEENGERSSAPASEAYSRQDAEKLLDGLRAREKRMPVSTRETNTTRRPDDERDW